MPKDILDIVDTAVKIGLGALISGVTTYYLTTLNHNKDSEKEAIRRKREMLEGVAEEIETFSNAVMEYWAYLVEFTRYKESPGEIPKGLKDKVEEAGSRLFKDYARLTNAESKLLLLGFNECEAKVRELGDYVKKVRRTPWKEESKLTSEEAESFREIILKKRKELFSELKNVYSS